MEGFLWSIMTTVGKPWVKKASQNIHWYITMVSAVIHSAVCHTGNQSRHLLLMSFALSYIANHRIYYLSKLQKKKKSFRNSVNQKSLKRRNNYSLSFTLEAEPCLVLPSLQGESKHIAFPFQLVRLNLRQMSLLFSNYIYIFLY